MITDTEPPKVYRNKLQRARRASPEAKAKAARASRKSYWKRQGAFVERIGTPQECNCSLCAKAKAALA